MKDEIEKYDEEIIKTISNEKRWPIINNNELIVEFLNIADKQFEKQTVDGYLCSILIYQQVIEEYLINLIKLSNLYLKAEIWPTRLHFRVSDKQMFGKLIQQHSTTIDFTKKQDLLKESKEFSLIRNKFVHSLLRFISKDEIHIEASQIKTKFHKITKLYLEGKVYFDWVLTDLQNRVDWEEMID